MRGGHEPPAFKLGPVYSTAHMGPSHLYSCLGPISVGDASLVEEECKHLDTGYPTNPKSRFAADALPAERIRFLPQLDLDTSIGPFPRAMDYFGAGACMPLAHLGREVV